MKPILGVLRVHSGSACLCKNLRKLSEGFGPRAAHSCERALCPVCIPGCLQCVSCIGATCLLQQLQPHKR